jgi:hypothetical protein
VVLRGLELRGAERRQRCTDEDCLELYDNTADAEPFGFADADCPQVQRAICERPAPGS